MHDRPTNHQVDPTAAVMDRATHFAPSKNTRAILWSSSARPVEAESVTKEPANVMSKLHKQTRQTFSMVHDTATDIEQNRTKPNKFDRIEHRRQPKPPGKTRKNPKKPERVQATISSKTLGIRAPGRPKKKVAQNLKPDQTSGDLFSSVPRQQLEQHHPPTPLEFAHE